MLLLCYSITKAITDAQCAHCVQWVALDARAKAVSAEYAAYQQSHRAKNEELRAVETRAAALSDELDALQREHAATQKSLQALEQTHAELKSELAQTREQKALYQKTVQYLMRARRYHFQTCTL